MGSRPEGQKTVFGGIMGDVLALSIYVGLFAAAVGAFVALAPPEMLEMLKKEVGDGLERMRETMHGVQQGSWNETEDESY